MYEILYASVNRVDCTHGYLHTLIPFCVYIYNNIFGYILDCGLCF